MKYILYLVSFLSIVINSYGTSWDSIKKKFPGLPPTIFTLLQDPDFLLKTGHATTARFIGGLQDVTNQHSKDYVYGRGAIHFAAESGSAGTISNLLRAGYLVTTLDNYGNTPLHSAAASGSGDAVITLLKAGAKADVRNQHGDTPLMFTILSCNPVGADALLKQMNNFSLEKEKLLKIPGLGNLTPLQQAVSSCPKLVKVLLDHGANPNYIITYSQTAPALHIAASLGLSDLVELLLSKGADVMLKDNLGQTALHKAAISRNSTSAAKLISKGGQELIDLRDNSGKKAIDYTESGSGFRNWFTRWKLGKWF